MIGRIEERVDLCDRHSLVRLSHLDDLVAGAHLAFLQNAEVETRPSAGRQQCRHPGLAHADADAIAGHARLSHLEERGTDPVAVADAHGIVGQSFEREVLAELSVDEVGPIQLVLPVAIRFDLVDEDGSLFTPVPGQVALTVSLEVQPADPTATTHRILPDRGAHGATVPLDVARKSHIHRQQSSHGAARRRGQSCAANTCARACPYGKKPAFSPFAQAVRCSGLPISQSGRQRSSTARRSRRSSSTVGRPKNQ